MKGEMGASCQKMFAVTYMCYLRGRGAREWRDKRQTSKIGTQTSDQHRV